MWRWRVTAGLCGLGVPGDEGSAPSQRGTKPLCPHVQAESFPARPPAAPRRQMVRGAAGRGAAEGQVQGKLLIRYGTLSALIPERGNSAPSKRRTKAGAGRRARPLPIPGRTRGRGSSARTEPRCQPAASFSRARGRAMGESRAQKAAGFPHDASARLVFGSSLTSSRAEQRQLPAQVKVETTLRVAGRSPALPGLPNGIWGPSMAEAPVGAEPPGCLPWLIHQPYLCLRHPASLPISTPLYFWQQETPPGLITPLWKVI